MRKRVLAVLIALTLCLSLLPLGTFAAEPVDSGTCGGEGDGTNLSWTLDSDGVLTISGTGKMADYSYPDYAPWYNNYRDSIKTVEIGNSVTSIGERAFYDCTSLTSIEIPNSVTSIGYDAFFNCTSLTSIIIPNSVTSIGADAFWYCTSLTSITVSKDNQYYASDENGVLFDKNKTTLIQYPIGNKRTSYTIPNSVTSICYDAFTYCTSLTSIEIPNSVTSIGEGAFAVCTSLTSIKIPNSVTSIDEAAFANCERLTSIEIPNSVTIIGYDAFTYCTSLTQAIFEGNAPAFFGYDAFDDCAEVFTIHAPKNDSTWTSTDAYDAEKQTWNGYPIVFDVEPSSGSVVTPAKEVEETPPADDTLFYDVNKNDWFCDSVNYVYEKGLMKGVSDTSFAPTLSTTRGMIVTILHRLEGTPAASAPCPFTDVLPGSWYEQAIAWGTEKAVVNGYGNGLFGPNDNITREQLAAILYRYAGSPSVTASLSAFTDEALVSDYAKTAMSWAIETGLMQGMGDNTLNPTGNATRAQVAAVLMRFCEMR